MKLSGKNKLLISAAAVVLVAVLLFIFAGDKADGPVVVKSADESAELSFKESALPADTTKDDITIERRSNVPDSDNIYAFYELKPDGLQLSEPATLKVKIPSSGGPVPVPVLFSAESVEQPDNLEISVAPDTTTVTASVEHFSSYVVHEGPLTLEADPGRVRADLGSSFSVSLNAEVESGFGDDGLVGEGLVEPAAPDRVGYHVELSSTFITELWSTELRGVVTPAQSQEAENQEFDGQYSNSVEFRCENTGRADINISTEFFLMGVEHGWAQGSYTTAPGGDAYRENMQALLSVPVECIAEEESQDENTTGTDTGEEERTSDIVMLDINNVYYPKHQFTVADPDACGAPHYHTNTAYGLPYEGEDIQTEAISTPDPAPNKCGFGKVSEVPTVTVTITYEQSVELIKYLSE